MKRKNIILSIGTLASVGLPLVAAVSCGTSWHKWSNSSSQETNSLKQDPTKSNVGSFNPNKPNDVSTGQSSSVTTTKSLFATRDITDIKAAAYDAQTNEINLNEVNNQFELNKLLIDIIGLKSPESLENYWKSSRWDDFKTYISNIKDIQDIKIKYTDGQNKPHDSTVKWDISKSKQAVINGLSAQGHFVDLEANEQKYFDSKTGSLSDEGFAIAKNAKDVSDPTLTTVSLMGVEIVSGLTSVDLDYAGKKLALLVNLPTPAFGSFKQLLIDMSGFTNQLFKVDVSQKYAFINESIKYWISENHLQPTINIANIDNKAKFPKGIIEGAFLLQAVSRKYDDLGR